MTADARGWRGRASLARHRLVEASQTRAVRRWLVCLLGAALLVFAGVEATRWVSFYQHVTRAQASLTRLEGQLDLASLPQSPGTAMDTRVQLIGAEADLRAAERHVRGDPIMALARWTPVLGNQARGVTEVVRYARSTVSTAVLASDVLVAYSERREDPARTALQEGVDFLGEQSAAMTEVRRSLEESTAVGAGIPGGLAGPLERRRVRVERAVVRMDELVTGYEEARAMAPSLLGFDRPRTYLLLAQNDTELFPSGGLISNYGIVTFADGQLVSMRFEYFVELLRRWQATSGNEYVEPPLALKHYLLRDTTWALGEAGWYPDFPTTAALARSFVEKGGAAPTDGTIAIDLRFVEALLRELGPVTVDDFGGVNVSAENLDEVVLEQTRSERVLPGAAGKAFLSSLAEEVVRAILAIPHERWLDLIETLGRMGEERHLQLHFDEPDLQAVATRYGFDGGMVESGGDYLMLADASVNSTKLNLILANSVEVDVRLDETSASSRVAYTTHNPFVQWQAGRDPGLVRALMLGGVYGSYLRLYAPVQARLVDLLVDGQSAGPQEDDVEAGRRVFGRYTPVVSGATSRVEFRYDSAAVVEALDGGWRRYRLYIQKQPGTRAFPLTVQIHPPDGALVRAVTLDGHPGGGLTVETDLRTDRVIEVEFRMPSS